MIRRDGSAEATDDGRPAVTTRGWSLEYLLEKGTNFRPIERISALDDPALVAHKVREHEEKNIPLIVEGFHKHCSWTVGLFTLRSLESANTGYINVRNCVNRTDEMMRFVDFETKCRATPGFAVHGETERLYGKDLACPQAWKDWLCSQSALPESTIMDGPDDLLPNLRKHAGEEEESEEVETLMCYQGIGDTFTPAHKDLCASSGQNIMVITEQDGCSYWFMAEGSCAGQAADLFQKFGHELDLETHIATPEQLSKAPFPFYVGKQVLGDLVLVPKRCCHQVINSGGISVKMSWSRMTVDGLITALHHELPVYRRVCRRETYRVKLLITRTTQALTKKLLEEPTAVECRRKLEEIENARPMKSHSSTSPPPPDVHEYDAPTDIQETAEKLHKVVLLLNKVIKEEFVDLAGLGDLETCEDGDEQAEGSKTFYGLTCDYCGADIFQSFFECLSCGTTDDGVDPDPLHICAGCYAEGRTCKCEQAFPRQRCRSAVLFKIQNAAINAVKVFFQGQCKPHKIGPKALTLIEQPAVFQAACILWKNRENASSKQSALTRICMRKHAVPFSLVCYCKKCHNSRCFLHILEDFEFHSSTALIEWAKDKEHDSWHKQHIGRKDRKEIILAANRVDYEAEKAGTACNMSVRLANIAKKYNREYSSLVGDNTKKGMYDGMYLEDDSISDDVGRGTVITLRIPSRSLKLGSQDGRIAVAAPAVVPGPRFPFANFEIVLPVLEPAERLKYKRLADTQLGAEMQIHPDSHSLSSHESSSSDNDVSESDLSSPPWTPKVAARSRPVPTAWRKRIVEKPIAIDPTQTNGKVVTTSNAEASIGSEVINSVFAAVASSLEPSSSLLQDAETRNNTSEEAEKQDSMPATTDNSEASTSTVSPGPGRAIVRKKRVGKGSIEDLNDKINKKDDEIVITSSAVPIWSRKAGVRKIELKVSSIPMQASAPSSSSTKAAGSSTARKVGNSRPRRDGRVSPTTPRPRVQKSPALRNSRPERPEERAKESPSVPLFKQNRFKNLKFKRVPPKDLTESFERDGTPMDISRDPTPEPASAPPLSGSSHFSPISPMLISPAVSPSPTITPEIISREFDSSADLAQKNNRAEAPSFSTMLEEMMNMKTCMAKLHCEVQALHAENLETKQKLREAEDQIARAGPSSSASFSSEISLIQSAPAFQGPQDETPVPLGPRTRSMNGPNYNHTDMSSQRGTRSNLVQRSINYNDNAFHPYKDEKVADTALRRTFEPRDRRNHDFPRRDHDHRQHYNPSPHQSRGYISNQDRRYDGRHYEPNVSRYRRSVSPARDHQKGTYGNFGREDNSLNILTGKSVRDRFSRDIPTEPRSDRGSEWRRDAGPSSSRQTADQRTILSQGPPPLQNGNSDVLTPLQKGSTAAA